MKMKQNKVDICLVDPPSLNIYIFLSPDRLSGRKDDTSDQTSDKAFFWKKPEHQEFMWLLKQFDTTVP